jgi:hypothetical protein
MTDPDLCYLCGDASPELCLDCGLCSTCSPPPIRNDVGRCEDCAAAEAADDLDQDEDGDPDEERAREDAPETLVQRFLAETLRRHAAVRAWLECRRQGRDAGWAGLDPLSARREPV